MGKLAYALENKVNKKGKLNDINVVVLPNNNLMPLAATNQPQMELLFSDMTTNHEAEVDFAITNQYAPNLKDYASVNIMASNHNSGHLASIH